MTSRRHHPLYQWLGSRGLFFAWLSALGAAIAASSPLHSHLEGISPTIPWFLGLFGHWQWPFLIIGILGSLLALATSRWSATIAVGMILFSWNLQISASPAKDEGEAHPAQALTVSTVNLNYDNQDLLSLLQWLDSSESPDIVILQEFTAAHQQVLGGTKGNQALRAYTHRSFHPQPDQFGMGVLSKWPFDEIEVVQPIETMQTLKLRMKVKWRGFPVLLTAVHPMPPISPAYAKVRDDSLRLEMNRLAQLGTAGILAGDFNDTPWSAGMRNLEPTLYRASGMHPTWPNANGFLSLLPLDHILVTGHWHRSTYALGPDIGSDHRPVIATLVAAP